MSSISYFQNVERKDGEKREKKKKKSRKIRIIKRKIIEIIGRNKE